MKHLKALLDNEHERRLDTIISLPVAKDYGLYPGILYPYLQKKQAEQENYGDTYNLRMGVKWIPCLTAAEIVQEVPAFPNTQTVLRAAATLAEAGVIMMETTGQFLERDHKTGRRRDVATWWCVSRDAVARKTPLTYWSPAHQRTISSLECAAYGVGGALILAHWRFAEIVVEEDGKAYRKLSAVDLEQVLPMDERTIRRHLKELLNNGALIQHLKKPKLYHLTLKEIMIKQKTRPVKVSTSSVPLKVVPKPIEAVAIIGNITEEPLKVPTPSVPLQVLPKPVMRESGQVNPVTREAPVVKLAMLDFHSNTPAIESSKPKPAFLEFHAA